MRILFWSLLLWLIVRTFVFQVCKVPTASMKNTLNEGDYILVNKLAYGPRIPITPFAIPFSDAYIDWQLPYFRLPGFSKVKRNDIIVFNYPQEDELPVDHRKLYVKRCIGLPGDEVKIMNAVVYVNGQKAEDPNALLNS